MRPTGFKYAPEEGSPSYLVVCDGGNVRSAAIATTLKVTHGREATAVGRLFMRPDTMYELCRIFDKIILTQPHMIESVPQIFHDKVIIADIGPDRWGISIPQELNTLADDITDALIEGEGNGNI